MAGERRAVDVDVALTRSQKADVTKQIGGGEGRIETFKLDFIHCIALLDGCNFFSLPAKILVHCAVGVSRSASLVLAYLMINHHLPLVEAIKTVKERRWIFPNRGFLKHLRNLDVQLRQRKGC